ncbi:MAG TPA: CRISPR-associated protein Csx19 [Syntrophorhabdaceae bacterium]|nr:CRISPR-associated protein Csx19 [Syntrophorhabdaceae bacterium]
MKANGLTMRDINSKVELIQTVTNIRDLAKNHFTNTAFAVIYLDYKVLIGTFEGGDFKFYKGETFEDRYVQRARIFDTDKELHIWRTAEGLKGRVRVDNEGEPVTVVDAYQVLFGTKAVPLDNGFTKLTEDRGTELIVPFEPLSIDDGERRLKLHTRNYVGFNEASQAGYVDCRFVEFVIP